MAAEKALRWRCRRGMKELDIVLVRYLDQRYAEASTAEQALFERVLDCEDDVLWNAVLGRGTLEDPELAAFVESLR